MATVPTHVFRTYDIRGKAETEITEDLCRLVGKAFGSELRERYRKDHPTVIVGRDARTHSPALEKTLIDGLVSTGCHVKTIGQTPTPVNYFAVCHFNADGSVQVTASHNDKEDNGLKLQIRNAEAPVLSGAEAFSGDDLQGLRRRIEEDWFATGDGLVEELDAVGPYVEKVTSIPRPRSTPRPRRAALGGGDDGISQSAPSRARPHSRARPPSANLKVATDFGNGVAGPVYAEALRRAGVNVIPLFAEPDGTFPNHIADPTKHETLTTLRETVKREKADCGIAFDGDGDRVGFVDENGNVISADYLLLLLAEDHLQRNPGASIVHTVSMSGILETEVKRLGGKPVMTVVGHSAVEEAMREHGSQLGGEQSGHFFCGEGFYDHDDALVAALRVLSIFSQRRNPKKPKKPGSPTMQPSPGSSDSSGSPESFSSLFSRYPKVFQSPEWRPPCPDDKKTDIVKRIAEHFRNAGYPCNTMDGVRIDFGSGAWALIRQSNTAPKISVCMEARSREKLAEVEGIAREHLAGYQEIGQR